MAEGAENCFTAEPRSALSSSLRTATALVDLLECGRLCVKQSLSIGGRQSQRNLSV